MIGVLSLGDVAAMCGPDPCGLWDYVNPSPECNVYQACAANQTIPALTGSDTVGNEPTAIPCLMGSGPLQPGQQFCPGMLDSAAAASSAYFTSQTPQPMTSPLLGNIPTWVLAAGGIVLLALVVGGGRRR